MKPVEKPPTRQPLKPQPQPVYSCPKCGQAMRKGFVCLAEQRTPKDLEQGIARVVATVLNGAASSITGSSGASLEFSSVGRQAVHVMEAGTVPTAYCCEACRIVAIFSAYALGGNGEGSEPWPESHRGDSPVE